MLFYVIFEEGFVIFVRYEGKCCAALANFIDYRAKNLVILTFMK